MFEDWLTSAASSERRSGKFFPSTFGHRCAQHPLTAIAGSTRVILSSSRCETTKTTRAMSFSSTTPTRPAPSSRTASCPSRPRSTRRTRTPTRTASATSSSETTRPRAPTRRAVLAARTSRSTTSKSLLLGFLEPHRHSAWFPVLPGTRYVPGRPRLPSEEAVFSLNPSVVATDVGLRDSWTCSDGQEAKVMAGETAWLLFKDNCTPPWELPTGSLWHFCAWL